MHTYKNYFRLITPIVILLLTTLTQQTYAQAPSITYPAPASDLTRGYSQSTLTVKVVFNGACTGATTLKVALPPSVTYVAGSVIKTAGTTAMSINESSIADLSNPIFNITGIAATGDNITFTVARNAGCGSLATAKDSVYIFTSGGCSSGSEVSGTVNTYNLLSPSLAITPPSTLTGAVIGTTATRTTTIINGGNGVTDTLRFYVVYPGGGVVNTSGINSITANGINFIPVSSSGDTLFYKIYGATLFGGDNVLSNGETVTISEPVKVVKCNTTTTYGAGWGKTNSNQCQIALATSDITMATGVPNLGITFSYSIPATTAACSGDTVTVTYTNNGTGGNAGAIYDITALLGNTTINTPVGRDGFTADDPKLNGTGSILAYTYAGGDSPNIVDMAQFTTNPDGAGTGLEDLDGDGKFDDLAPGQSFSITYTRKVIYDTANCSFTYYATAASQVTYNTMCKGTAPITTVIVGSDLHHEWTYYGASKIAPPSVYPGVPFTARICVTGSFSPPNPAATDSLEVFITLPAGVTYTGTSSFNGGTAPDYIVQTGNILAIREKWLNGGGSTGFCLSFEMTYDCSGSGNLNLPFDIRYVADRSCNAIYKMGCTDNIAIATHCPFPCPTGPSNHAATVTRTTLGWTDKTLTTKVTSASLTPLSLKTVTVYDTVNIKEGATQNGTYSNLYYFFQEDKASGFDVFNFVSGTFHFKSGGTGTEIVCSLPTPDASASTAALTKLKFNIGSLLGGACGLPATLNTSDTFWVDMNYSIGSGNNEGLYGTHLQTPPNTNAYFYNLDASATQQYCDVANPEVYVIGLEKNGAIDYGHPRNITGCTSTDYSLEDYRLFNTDNIDNFPNEYRPTQYIDSVIVTLPTGIYLDPSVPTSISYQNWDGTGGNNAVTPIISGSKMSFINPGTWFISDIASLFGFANARLYYSILPSCSVDPANTNISVTYYKHDFYYSGLQAQTVSTYTRTNAFTYNATTAPSITVQNNTGTVQGIKTQQYWDVQINSTGTTTAPYVWLALEKSTGTGSVSIDSVVLQPSGVKLTPSTYNTTDHWYQVSTSGLTTGSAQQARIYFKYGSCTLDSILLKSGWNCTGYPSPNPLTGYACTAAQTYLKIDPQPSQVQLSVTRQPGGGSSINLCTTDSTLLILNSAQAANLINPYIIFYPPTGVTMGSTIQVEYPLGSGNYQNAAITSVTGGGYKIDLTAHSGIGTNGMLGTASSNPAFSPLGGDRQAKIKLDFTTSCSFSSGSSFTFNAYGSKPCGAAAIDNGISATTAALNITGASVVGSAGVVLNFGSTTSAGCGTPVTVSLTTTPTGVGTLPGDTMVYTLPIGLAYAGALTSGFTAVTSGSGGVSVVKIAMPTGVAASTPINYNFNVMPSGEGCGNVNMIGAYKRNSAILSCGGTPCSNNSVIIASATSPSITLNKPALTITSISVDSSKWIAGQYQNVYLTYNNVNGVQNYTGGTDSVEFFCGSSTTPFAIMPLTKSLAIGASDSDHYFMYVPKTGCSIGNLVTAKIQTTTIAGTQQCLCAPSAFTLAGIALPLNFLTTYATTDNCAVNINWTYNLSGGETLQNFSIERSNNGSDYSAIATLKTGAISYTDVAPYSGIWYYRIKAITTDTKFVYSKTLTAQTTLCTTNAFKIYPNPANSQVQIVLQGNSTNSSFELIDALSRILSTGKLQNNYNNTINISTIPTGLYVLKIVTDGEIQTSLLHIVH